MSEQVEQAANDLNWPSADIVISYDAERQQIRYATISTNETLMIWDCRLDRRTEPPQAKDR